MILYSNKKSPSRTGTLGDRDIVPQL